MSTHRFGAAVLARRGCLLACGISFGRCCLDGRSGGAASAAMAFIRSPDARIASAQLFHARRGCSRAVAAAPSAVAIVVAPVALFPGSCGVHLIALIQRCFSLAALTRGLDAYVVAAAASSTAAMVAAQLALLFEQPWRSSDRIEHASAWLGTAHAGHCGWRAGGGSLECCLLEGRSGGAVA